MGIKKIIKGIFHKFGLEVTRYSPKEHEKVISLKSEKNSHGNVLISYILQPFLLKQGEEIPNGHTHYLRSWEIVMTFLKLGFNVDVIDYRNREFIPHKKYVFFLDARHNLERLSPILNSDCTKILYIDTAHILFHIAGEIQRLRDLQKRKGVILQPKRYELPNMGIEHADFAIGHGNEFTLSTYRYARKPIFRIPQIHNVFYPFWKEKNMEVSSKSFLWFGSRGFVHKGLDLVLDAFMEMPDLQLYVCGPISQEKDFEKAYRKELYEMPHIHTIGWVDITSQAFIELGKKCIGLVYPSCSEGGAGSVVQCMHAGIIPIISYESGVDVLDFGITLRDCSVNSIKENVRKVSLLSGRILKEMSRGAWEHARSNHTRDHFREIFLNTINTIHQTSIKQRKEKEFSFGKKSK